MQTAEWAPIAQILLGYAIQWTRGHKAFPNWLGYALLGLGTFALYAWATPDVDKAFSSLGALAHSWRSLVAGAVSFFLAARGAASTSSDVKAAPATNSLG